MAQLPPKVPQHWPHDHFNPNSHQKTDQAFPISGDPGPSWVDEFLDFSSTRRGSHRRSMSDSVAFLEAPPPMDGCRRPSDSGSHVMMMVVDHDGHEDDDDNDDVRKNYGMDGGDRLDDEEQLMMSMFADVGPAAGTLSNPSSPSDHNSINDDERLLLLQQAVQGRPLQVHPKSEPTDQEAQSSCQLEDGGGVHALAPDNSGEKIVDPKRIKRILANRQSAQRSRVRKLQYISELERSVTSLQAEVSVLSPRVAFLDHHRLVLNVDNSVLKQRIAALAQDKVFKDAHQEALKREIERLRQIYYEQNHLKKNVDNIHNSAGAAAAAADTNPHKDNQLAVN